jgi:hypothetical protein
MGMLGRKGLSLEEGPPEQQPELLPTPKPPRTRAIYVEFRALVEAYRLSVAGPALAPPPNAMGATGAAAAPPAAMAPANTGPVGATEPVSPTPEGGRS